MVELIKYTSNSIFTKSPIWRVLSNPVTYGIDNIGVHVEKHVRGMLKKCDKPHPAVTSLYKKFRMVTLGVEMLSECES